MGTCPFKDYTFSFEVCNTWLGFLGGGVFSHTGARLTFFSSMPGLLRTPCAMRKREGNYGHLAE